MPQEPLDELVCRLEELLTGVEQFPEPMRSEVFELLDGVDTLHRLALNRLISALDPSALEALRLVHPAVAWLLDVYAPDHATSADPPAPTPVAAQEAVAPPAGATLLPMAPR